MASYPKCERCGNDLTTHHEQEQGYCDPCYQAVLELDEAEIIKEAKMAAEKKAKLRNNVAGQGTL